ncbi:MAG: hypothetical protein U9R01_05620 [candidate division WOR-3 bacterium]|nr:hypothetical protein [candidate division WOR-3 bacterium]
MGATSSGCAKTTVAQHLIRAAGPYGAASLSTDPYGHTTRMGHTTCIGHTTRMGGRQVSLWN